MTRNSLLLALVAAVAFTTACSDVTSTAPNLSPSFAKSGTGASGGGGGGGGSSLPGNISGPPVAPTYTARIDSIGVVPTALYYGTPSQWTVGGYVFQASFTTHLKPLAGPLVVGACVAVSFSETDGVYNASELKSVDQTKCN